MRYENKILNLFNNGIRRSYLTKLVKENIIERVGRGIYIKKDVLVDEFIFTK